MENYTNNPIRKAARGTINFFAPQVRELTMSDEIVGTKSKAVLIPTYGPNNTTYELIRSLLKWYPDVTVVVIDDCTPLTPKYTKTLDKMHALAKEHAKLRVLRTPTNELKAGALNFGIDYLMNLKKIPDVIFTFDDDVRINPTTITTMVEALYSERHIGGVCSEVRVDNKNANILTRLQALEYHNFNITKISENGFVKGPLVMQGMLSAFRTEALVTVKGFTKGHLIEDYDLTARLKSKGWKVKIAQKAIAWTEVPETIEQLWKQRVRWISGGLTVLGQFKNQTSAVYQDVIGHGLFLSLFALVILSFFVTKHDFSNPGLTLVLIALSLFNFFVAFIFNIVSLSVYHDAGKRDWLLKLSIIPELIYSNMLSIILLGSYLFVLYNFINRPIAQRISLMQRAYGWGLSAFSKAGFSQTWGTRS